MANISKGPYYWDVRGASSEIQAFTADNIDNIPQGSTYLETDGDHDIFIWNAVSKSWDPF